MGGTRRKHPLYNLGVTRSNEKARATEANLYFPRLVVPPFLCGTRVTSMDSPTTLYLRLRVNAVVPTGRRHFPTVPLQGFSPPVFSRTKTSIPWSGTRYVALVYPICPSFIQTSSTRDDSLSKSYLTQCDRLMSCPPFRVASDDGLSYLTEVY